MKKKRRKIKQTIDECSNIKIQKNKWEIKINNYLLTDSDRLTYVYCINSKNKITEVINVSYELLINKKWITIVRFDSSHGYLHRHMRISLNDPNTTTDNINVIKKGNPSMWLTWAIKFTNKSYYDYKLGFCKRSKISIIDILTS